MTGSIFWNWPRRDPVRAPLTAGRGTPFHDGRQVAPRGLDAVHVKEVGLSSTPDPLILEYDRSEKRSCVTLDLDFHQLLAATGATEPSVILLRFQRLRAEQAAALIETILGSIGPDLETGVAVTATRRGLRIRRLPLK